MSDLKSLIGGVLRKYPPVIVSQKNESLGKEIFPIRTLGQRLAGRSTKIARRRLFSLLLTFSEYATTARGSASHGVLIQSNAKALCNGGYSNYDIIVAAESIIARADFIIKEALKDLGRSTLIYRELRKLDIEVATKFRAYDVFNDDLMLEESAS
jgi:hypothetical protein